jgi:hypothetical protein
MHTCAAHIVDLTNPKRVVKGKIEKLSQIAIIILDKIIILFNLKWNS